MRKKVKEKILRLAIITTIALSAAIFIFWNFSQKQFDGIEPTVEVPKNSEII